MSTAEAATANIELSTTLRFHLPVVAQYLGKLRSNGYSVENLQNEVESLELYISHPSTVVDSTTLGLSWWELREYTRNAEAFERYKDFEEQAMSAKL